MGDSFVTGHPISGIPGPQMLHPTYPTDPAAALAGLQNLAGAEASVVLPGHGHALRMPLADAHAEIA